MSDPTIPDGLPPTPPPSGYPPPVGAAPTPPPDWPPSRDLARGPARLARAFAIDGSLDGHALDAPPLWIEPPLRPPAHEVVASPRIGVSRAADWPLRFFVRGSPFVS